MSGLVLAMGAVGTWRLRNLRISRLAPVDFEVVSTTGTHGF